MTATVTVPPISPYAYAYMQAMYGGAAIPSSATIHPTHRPKYRPAHDPLLPRWRVCTIHPDPVMWKSTNRNCWCCGRFGKVVVLGPTLAGAAEGPNYQIIPPA